MRNKKTYSRFIQNVLSWKAFSKGKLIQSLHHCVEHDITSFDNTDFKGEEYIGKIFGTALSESGLSRDEIQLISKYSSPGSSGEKLIQKVDDHLLTLDTDYLDLLLLDYPHLTAEIKEALAQLISQGKVLEIGGLNLNEPQLKSFEIPMAANLIPSPFVSPNALSEIPVEEESVKDCLHFVWHSTRTSLGEGAMKGLKEISDEYKIPTDQLYLRWLLQHPAHLHIILSEAEKEDISAAVASKEKQLEPLDWKKIDLILS